MLRFVFRAAFLCCACSTFAQAPDIEVWMQRHFSGKANVKQDLAADEALYAALGLDSLRKNRFIGEVQGIARLPNGSMPVQFILWTDTLEAILHLTQPGDTTTYVADLRNNTITIHTSSTEEGEINSSINDLRERVVVNWYRYKDDTSPWRVNRVKRYNTQGGILAQDMQRWTVANGDTIRFLRYGHGPSPFLDALEWLPYSGDYPFNLIMQLARAGDPIPRTLKSNAGSIEVTIVGLGTRPRPAYRIGKNVTELRTKAHTARPIRADNRRANIVELDPMISIPDDERHMWATADPGDPDEPEVTYTGRRSQMRLNNKIPCGEAGTVVVKVWIDRNGKVQRAEVDGKKSTLRSEDCRATALEAAKLDTYYPMEGGIPWHQGEVVFAYKAARDGSGTARGPATVSTADVPYTWELQGRKLEHGPERIGRTGSPGRVIMEIRVDRKGTVRGAMPGWGSTTTEEITVDAARNAALQMRFSADPSAPEQQFGRVTFVFLGR